MLKKIGQSKAAVYNKSMILEVHLDKIYEKVDIDQVEMRVFNVLEEAESWLDTE